MIPSIPQKFAMTSVVAMGACAPIPYLYSAEEKSSQPSTSATDVVQRVAHVAWDYSDAINAARRFCGLAPVESADLASAATELNVSDQEGQLINRSFTFECPVSGEEIQ